MTLPIEPTPVLEDEEVIVFYKMQEEWTTSKSAPKNIKVNEDTIRKGMAAIKARREKRKQNQESNSKE